MARYPARVTLIAIGALVALSACGGADLPGFLGGGKSEGGGSADEVTRSTRLVERDVEAPDAFQVTEPALWDGRPSLGGVWVAHPDVTDPERVIIRNETNDQFVIGALFKRERETPGPRLQLSSDAAEALGVLAGQPVQVNVTALRREESGEETAEAATGAEGPSLPAPEAVETAALDAPEAAQAPDPAPAAAEPAAPAPEATPAPSAAGSPLDRPYIQIGIFSVEQNADNTATSLRRTGIVPTIKKQTSQGRTFWRVTVGPTASESERADILDKVKELGFSDAYYVSS
ncbi:SPOR domain-containing protein [Tranquillimonas rosea]|uniref:SPOR domain-containing protein n=1 Tax=Tranquillimonas rosea TaxID=641238 RepID=UPI000B8873DE|nr:SPOR domain-containing protein [Tranquillimonas rosea]